MPHVPTAEPYEFAFDPSTTALLVIDMQRDFVDPGGFGEALGNDVSLLCRAVEPTRPVLDAPRATGMLGIHTRSSPCPTSRSSTSPARARSTRPISKRCCGTAASPAWW